MRMIFMALVMVFFYSTAVNATSVSLLYGENFREDLGKKERLTLTIENFALWEYGTVFYYYDITEPLDDDAGPVYSNQFFGGISPTFSLTKLTGKEMKMGWLQDISIRLEIENGSGNGTSNFRNYFYGLQYDLAVPGFDFLSLNTVLRDNPNSRGVGVQLGAFWQMSWDYGRWKRLKFTGFLAASPWDGDIDPEATGFFEPSNRGRFLTSQPQLLWDLGYGWFGKKDRVEVGVEYAYFLNRFQLRHRDEKVLQAMVKLSY